MKVEMMKTKRGEEETVLQDSMQLIFYKHFLEGCALMCHSSVIMSLDSGLTANVFKILWMDRFVFCPSFSLIPNACFISGLFV